MLVRGGVALFLLLFLVAVSGCIVSRRPAATPTPWPTAIAAERPLYDVKRGTVADQWTMKGQVVPVEWEPLYFVTGGELAALKVTEGDTVRQGDILAELEARTLQDQLAQAQVSLEQAQDALAQEEAVRRRPLERARLNLRMQELILEDMRQSEGQVRPVEIALQEIRVEVAQSEVREIEERTGPALERNLTKAKLQVQSLQRQIEELRLRAPFDGQVVSLGFNMQGPLQLTRGSRPRVGDKISSFSPIIVVARPGKLHIVVSAEVPRATELAVGQVVTVSHPLAPNEPFTARVSALPVQKLAPSGESLGGQVVSFALPPGAPSLSMGDAVELTVVAAVHVDTLYLPPAAIRRVEKHTFVVVKANDGNRRIDVSLGIENDRQIEIVSGLREGDVIVGQ